jgi:serine/threonine protein kinase
MTQTDTCPEPKSLLLLASGQLPAEDVERLAKHLESCVRCVETLTGLKAEDTLADAVRAAADTGEITPSTAVRELMNQLKGLRAESEPRTAATLPPTGDEVQPDRSHDFLAPAQSVDEIGRLGPYRVIRELGGGGMGTVFLAEDPQLLRLVALKTMNPSLAASAAARERFIREARATAKVKHDHVVTIHQVGEDRSIPFIAMELLEGETLEARLKREARLPCPEVLRIGQEIARGLAAAHKRGLLHRDIKPANIWLESVQGEPGASAPGVTRAKIVDFGLARAASGDAQLTQEGAIIGTPAYMAPEQATNTNVDHRCDLFSLGCVLYRMAAGVPPFKGTDTISTLMSVATDQPTPPHVLNSQLPRLVSDFIMRLLEKSPEKRPASAQEVAERLREMGREFTLPSPPLRGRGAGGEGVGATGGPPPPRSDGTPPPAPPRSGEGGKTAPRPGRCRTAHPRPRRPRLVLRRHDHPHRHQRGRAGHRDE